MYLARLAGGKTSQSSDRRTCLSPPVHLSPPRLQDAGGAGPPEESTSQKLLGQGTGQREEERTGKRPGKPQGGVMGSTPSQADRELALLRPHRWRKQVCWMMRSRAPLAPGIPFAFIALRPPCGWGLVSSVEVRGQAAECKRPRFEIRGLFSSGPLATCNLQRAPFSLSTPTF